MFRRLLYRTYRRSVGLRYFLRRWLTPAGQFALVFLVIAVGLGADTNQTTAYQAIMFLVVAFVVAMLWSLLQRARPPLTLTRRLPRFGTAEQAVNYTVVVGNPARQPRRGLTLFEDLADPRPSFAEFAASGPATASGWMGRLDARLGYTQWWRLVISRQLADIPGHPVAQIPPRGVAECRVTFTPRRRGRLQFIGATLAQPDVFGLVHRFERARAPQSLLILPKRYPLPPLAFPGTSRYQRGGVALASAVGQSDEFVSLRDYRPGDPLRHVHWRSVAKTGQLVVREHQDEFFVRHALILDTFAAPGMEAVFEEAVAVAASFVCTVQTQESLLDLLFIGAEAFCFTAGRGVGHADRLLEVLAGVTLCGDKSFASLASLVLGHVPAVSGCVCVFLAWDEPRQRLVRALRALGLPLRVFIVTETEAPDALPPGPMADRPRDCHQLRVGRVGEALVQL